MGRKSPLKIIVLGAGPSGLCAAWNLVKDGYDVTVLEKESVCGGQSITFQKADYKYDLGPHNVHSQRKSVIDFIKRNLGDDFKEHRFSAQIYFRGHRINYPLLGIDVLKSISPLTVIHCGFSFLWSRFSSFFIPAFRDDGSYKTWVVNRFGREFYDVYFGPYSEKVWKIPPEELSDVVAKKRIAVSGIIELLHSVFFKQQRYHPENPTLINNYYHIKGIGTLSDFFVKGIIEGGGKILTESAVERIVVSYNRVEAVYYSSNGQKGCLDFRGDSIDAEPIILSTIPVNEMIGMINGDIPTQVIDAASELNFTSEVFLYLNMKGPKTFNVPLFYFSEMEFPFNRIYDVGLFSRDMIPFGKNALCLELSCNYNDSFWNMDDRALFEKCIVPLERHELLSRDEVEGYHTKRLKHAYPLFRVGYEKRLNTIFGYIEALDNLVSFGREGLFVYANVDDAVWMGFEVAKHINYRDRINLSIRELLPSYVSF